MFFCLLRYKSLDTKITKVFFVYILFQGISALLCYFSFYTLGSYELYMGILRFHLPLEFLIMTYFFFILFEKQKYKLLTIAQFPIFILLFYLDYRVSNSTSLYTISTLYEFSLFTILILILLFEKIKNETTVLIYETTEFWICVSFITYFSGNFFYILLVETSKSASSNTKLELTLIYCFVTILKNCFFSLTIFFKKRNPNEENLIDSNSNTFNTLTANNT